MKKVLYIALVFAGTWIVGRIVARVIKDFLEKRTK
jgi:hypothetical protein